MTLRFHEIAESNLRIQNPLDEAKLLLLGQACNLEEGMNILDLACGKGEALIQWANHYNINGIGVDLSPIFIANAQQRAYLMDVGNKLNFIQADAMDYPQDHHQFDVVSCLSSIGDGLTGMLELMRTALKRNNGVLVVGEAFWSESPTVEVYDALSVSPQTFTSLGGILDQFEASGFELIEMVLASQDDIDRYETSQWQAISQFVEANPDDPEIQTWRNLVSENRRSYLHFGRRYMGWGAFVLKEAESKINKPIATSSNPNRPIGIDIVEGMLWVRLADGRVIGNPLEWYPWLQSASKEEKDDLELTATGITWHSLSRRMDVSELLKGKRVV